MELTANRPRIYVAGPISIGNRDTNIDNAVNAGKELFKLGYAPFVPHLYDPIEGNATLGSTEYEEALQMDFNFIAVCDGILRLPGESSGADREVAFAQSVDIPVFTTVSDIRAAIFPRGDARFHTTLSAIGRLHDRKQADYGQHLDPFANIRGSAEWGIPPWIGAMARANDKLRRLQKFAKEGKLANESAEDSFLDLAVYALIAYVLYREDK